MESESYIIGDYEVDLSLVIGKGIEQVYQGCHIPSGRMVAVKVVDSAKRSEYEIMSKLKGHDNIISLLGTASVEDHTFMFMEYVDRRLLDFVNTAHRNETINMATIRLLLSQLVKGLKYMHSKRIYHGDIKLDNILLSSTSRSKSSLKYIDFGFSNQLPTNVHLISDKRGTKRYASPQMYLAEPHDPFKSDIYSLGVVFYAIAFGKLPFNDLQKLHHDQQQQQHQHQNQNQNQHHHHHHHHLQQLLQSNSCLPFHSKTHPKTHHTQHQHPCEDKQVRLLKELIGSMLSYNPNDRPDIRTIEKHAFFQKRFNWLNSLQSFF